MTNGDVIELVDLGVTDDVIATMIAQRPSAFALGASDLSRLSLLRRDRAPEDPLKGQERQELFERAGVFEYPDRTPEPAHSSCLRKVNALLSPGRPCGPKATLV